MFPIIFYSYLSVMKFQESSSQELFNISLLTGSNAKLGLTHTVADFVISFKTASLSYFSQTSGVRINTEAVSYR